MTAEISPFIGRTYSASDGLSLYYREYGDAAWDTTPLLCLAGLTRNSADFDDLAVRMAATGRRVIAPDYRGRGRSAFDPHWQNYSGEVQLGDVATLLTVLNLHRVVVIGTSFGGLLSMGLAIMRPTVLAGVVLNDVGPEIDAAGLSRIANYIGTPVSLESYEDAARQQMHLFSPAYPDLDEAGWMKMARASYRQSADGKLVADYDLNLGKALAAAGPPADLWPSFRALQDIPCLALRGALSDVLSLQTFDRMAVEVPQLKRMTIPHRGHVPLLTEPTCTEALDEFLKSL